jgi:hypothetical protein
MKAMSPARTPRKRLKKRVAEEKETVEKNGETARCLHVTLREERTRDVSTCERRVDKWGGEGTILRVRGRDGFGVKPRAPERRPQLPARVRGVWRTALAHLPQRRAG